MPEGIQGLSGPAPLSPEYATCLKNGGGALNDGEAIFYSWSETAGFTVPGNLSSVTVSGDSAKVVRISCGVNVSGITGAPSLVLYIDGADDATADGARESRGRRAVSLTGAGFYALDVTMKMNANAHIETRIVGGTVTLASDTSAFLSCARVR